MATRGGFADRRGGGADRAVAGHPALLRKSGLIEAVDRSSGGQRRYASGDLAWLEFLLRLRATGMSIADMQRFAELRRGGDRTIADRLTLLREHRIGVERHIADLHNHLAALARKIDLYESLLDEHGGTDTR